MQEHNYKEKSLKFNLQIVTRKYFFFELISLKGRKGGFFSYNSIIQKPVQRFLS